MLKNLSAVPKVATMLEQKFHQLLRDCPFLDGLTAGERDGFIDAGRKCHVLQGAFFFHQGDPATLFYITFSLRGGLNWRK